MRRIRPDQDSRIEPRHGQRDEHPIVKYRRLFWALVLMPTLAAVAWWKAASYNPYTTSFFTKIYIAPSPELPGEMRLAGWVIVTVGALLLVIFMWGLAKKRLRASEGWAEILFALLLVAFGGAFFVAAQSAQFHIDQRTISEGSER